MKEIIESKLELLKSELTKLENKRVVMSDLTAYRENYLDITLCKIKIDHLNKMLEEEKFEIVL